jgi:thiamine-phosphate pyrophosphorylase
MSAPEQPQLYLITPPTLSLNAFPAQLAQVLDAHPVACLRLDLATRDEDKIARAADACREVAHARDVAIVVRDHLELAERLGLDGVHLSGGASNVRAARKALGPDAIVGQFCGTSRHDGLESGDAGADYIAFGPVAGATGDGQLADFDLFAWWSEMIELPVVAEGALSEDALRTLAPVIDFVALGEEIWEAPDPVAHMARLSQALLT